MHVCRQDALVCIRWKKNLVVFTVTCQEKFGSVCWDFIFLFNSAAYFLLLLIATANFVLFIVLMSNLLSPTYVLFCKQFLKNVEKGSQSLVLERVSRVTVNTPNFFSPPNLLLIRSHVCLSVSLNIFTSKDVASSNFFKFIHTLYTDHYITFSKQKGRADPAEMTIIAK